jgi:hypothetical protein
MRFTLALIADKIAQTEVTMIRPLRTIHFYFWRVFGLFLPVIFFLAVAFHPHRPKEVTSPQDFLLTSHLNSDSSATVSISVLNALKFPSCEVIAISQGTETLIGLLHRKGKYEFRVRSRLSKIRLYDRIKGRQILEYQIR